MVRSWHIRLNWARGMDKREQYAREGFLFPLEGLSAGDAAQLMRHADDLEASPRKRTTQAWLHGIMTRHIGGCQNPTS
jgi:hypothetical protein